jgi:hypothetical protein
MVCDKKERKESFSTPTLAFCLKYHFYNQKYFHFFSKDSLISQDVFDEKAMSRKSLGSSEGLVSLMFDDWDNPVFDSVPGMVRVCVPRSICVVYVDDNICPFQQIHVVHPLTLAPHICKENTSRYNYIHT